MMDIKGLKLGQSVRIGDGDVVYLPSGKFLINGVEVSGHQQVYVPCGDFIKILKFKRGSVLHYINKDTDESMSVDKYNDKSEDFYVRWGEYFEGDVTLDNTQLAEMYSEKAKLDKWEPVREPDETTKEIWQPELVGSVVDTGSDFISQSILFGTLNHNGRGVFLLNTSDVAKDEFVKVCNQKATKYVLPDHGNIKFAKVNGKYVFTNNRQKWVDKGGQQYFNDINSAKDKETEVREFVRDVINGITNDRVITYSEVYKALDNLTSGLRTLDVKAKAEDDRRRLVNSVTKFMKEISDANN